MEVTVRQSELDWILVRPAPLTDGPASGVCRAGPEQRLAAFRLRDDVRFHSGAPLTADDVAEAVRFVEDWIDGP